MPKTKTKPTEAESNELLQARMNRYFDTSKTGRSNIDWNWFKYDLWYMGNHYSRWDRNTQQIISAQPTDGKPKVVINLVYATVRSVANYTVRNKPRAEVTPVDSTEKNVDEAVKINKYLDFLHDKLQLRNKLRSSVKHSLKYSVGFWQILWNADAEGGGEIEVNIVDPYDLYFDPAARFPTEARFAVLAVRRNIDDLKEDPKYKEADWSKVVPDKQLSASSLKTRIIQSERGDSVSFNEKKDSGTVIVKECWYKEDGEVYVCAVAGNQIIRKPEATGLTRLPFFRLLADEEPLSMYGQGWIKNLIPANREINRLMSHLAEYNNIMNRGKWISDKGAGVRIINNENGQIIEKKRGYEVTQGAIAPLSNAIYQELEALDRYFEELGGMHDASMGRTPTGVKSGRALEALQVGDSNNLSELTENVEEFLEEVYEYILSLAAEKYQFARNITPLGKSGTHEFIKVIGEGADNKPEGVTVIPKKNMVDVKINSWLASTQDARRETLKELYQLQAIDAQTLLEGYNIGNVADIMQRVRQQKADEAKQAAEQAKQQAQASEGGQGPADVPQAIAILRQVLSGNGQIPQVPQQVTPNFIKYIDSFLKSAEGQQLHPDQKQMIQQIRDQAVHAMQQPSQPSQPAQPQQVQQVQGVQQ